MLKFCGYLLLWHFDFLMNLPIWEAMCYHYCHHHALYAVSAAVVTLGVCSTHQRIFNEYGFYRIYQACWDDLWWRGVEFDVEMFWMKRSNTFWDILLGFDTHWTLSSCDVVNCTVNVFASGCVDRTAWWNDSKLLSWDLSTQNCLPCFAMVILWLNLWETLIQYTF